MLTAQGPNANIDNGASHIVLYARTDSTGRFKLSGLLPNDIITVENLKYYSKHSVSGSRFITINLPAPRQAESITSTVMAKRQKPKTMPEFQLEDFYKDISVNGPPLFPGGKEGFTKYIQRQLSYPKKAIQNNIEGTVEVAFDINRDGYIQNLKLLRGIGYECDEEVMHAVANSPRWITGRVFGRPESLTQTVAIQFKLTDK
jgi:TonB family protein